MLDDDYLEDDLDDGSEDDLTLRDGLGNLIGRIEEQDDHLVARDHVGNRLGEYDPGTNRTIDPVGRLVGYGNWLTRLFGR